MHVLLSLSTGYPRLVTLSIPRTLAGVAASFTHWPSFITLTSSNTTTVSNSSTRQVQHPQEHSQAKRPDRDSVNSSTVAYISELQYSRFLPGLSVSHSVIQARRDTGIHALKRQAGAALPQDVYRRIGQSLTHLYSSNQRKTVKLP